MDIVDKATRSRMMSGIKGRDTKPEIIVRRYLHSEGYRFRLHRKDLPGSPDIVMARARICIFIHGCFWHRHQNCKYATVPKSRHDFWQKKFDENIARDNRAQAALKEAGWNVIVIWECELREPAPALHAMTQKISETINNSKR